MKKAFIISGTRTAIGNFGGKLSTVRPDDLAAEVIKSLVAKNPQVPVSEIGEVVMGCANQAGEDNRNIARMALLIAGLPFTVPGVTVNRLCASGLNAVYDAARMVKLNETAFAIAGGVENMTRGPWVISKASTAFGRDSQMFDSSFGWRFIHPKMKEMYGTEAMGETAENLAEQYSVSRERQDRFALMSQQKAAKAQQAGRFEMEITPIEIPQKKGENIIFKDDEFIKPNTNTDTLAKLNAAFRKNGTVTAGNSSGLNDGAAALLISSEDGIKKYGLDSLAEIVSVGVSGVEPRIMGIGPVEATNKALKNAGLTLNNIDLIEINEAFASQVLSCTQLLGMSDNDERLNVNGGAIALGHPLGMSGARIILTAALELKIRNLKYALVTMCIGVGQGYAVIIKNSKL